MRTRSGFADRGDPALRVGLVRLCGPDALSELGEYRGHVAPQ
jgi:hypothetical protein